MELVIFMLYQSLDNPKIKDLKKLHTHKYREQKKMFLVEGEHLVLEAFQTGYLKELLLEENTEFSLPVETNYVTKSVLKELSNLDTPSSIIGVCVMKESTEEIGNRVLVLDRIQDPGNMGTIIRSAVAFDVDTILLSEDCVDIYNSKVIRATQGLLFHIPIRVCHLKEKLLELKEKDYPIYVTKVNGGKDVRSVSLQKKYVLVMGNEGSGVRQEMMEIATDYLYIPMNEKCESLNVGVATSILLFALKDCGYSE